MKPERPALPNSSTKACTGVSGFDEITGGGLPHGRTTLIVGGPGSGKTVMSLQFLAHGAVACAEPGIFVAFEEASKRIVANAASFGWQLAALRKSKKLFFLDAQPKPDLIQSGEFDLCGMLAVLEAQIRLMKARRIVFDALDVVLALLPDLTMQRREIYRLHDWLLTRGLTGIITAKVKGDEIGTSGNQAFGSMQFMVDCAVILNHQIVLGVSQRNLRVLKYRGSGFDENESPFLIAANGLEVAVARASTRTPVRLSKERVSSGVARLDTMLGGGYYRGASVLITGFSGTAKTTLSGAFAEAACLRGERTLFISFDADSKEVVRNLGSVDIRLDPHVKSGVLKLLSARAITGSAETYLLRIKTLARAHGARCLVIDPVSTWYKSGNDLTVQSVADRLIYWAKIEGITMVCTSLLDEMTDRTESNSSLQISALADTWIHLNYLMQAGERNRGLSIVKSRGSAHSNQLRELILSDSGVTLADIYNAGGEVLMGTLRWEKEHAEAMLREAAEIAGRLKRVNLDVEEAEMEARMKALQVELMAKQVEKELLTRTTLVHKGELSRGLTRVGELRGADAVPPRRK
jgi:circadian clock protein KaiC